MPADPSPTIPSTRKQHTMNSPFATQTQTEARIASRLTDPEKIRRALRLDNPHMWGEKRSKPDVFGADGFIPTPAYPTATQAAILRAALANNDR